ncbi:efflux RND transporter periplasmic adaptor subunit [Methylocella sp.]|uniref:efflux RND transporter periplasmic adaptor subunit n=1 Tax=Methylocella sp. TaxID=1978226 RepID=UPI0037845934
MLTLSSAAGLARSAVLAAVLVFAVGPRAFAEDRKDAPPGPPPPQVTVAPPLARTVPRWDEYTGRFEPLQQVEVRPRVSGAVDSIHFTDGQLVKVGDLLFTIDPRPYQNALDSARADVVKARAQVEVATSDVARAQQLVESRAITGRDVDQRKSALDIARAQQLSAEAALHNAELNLEWTQVRAPIEGRVSDHRVDVGNLVQGGQSGASLLTTIVTLDPIHFVFDASEADYIRYARLATANERPSSREFANPVMVRLADEPDWSHAHNGKMDFVDNQLNARSGTIRGRAKLDNKDLFLLPGAFGRLRLFGGDIKALLVPDDVIVSDQANKIVLVVGPDNKVAPRRVTLGPLHEGLRVVLGGLDPADRVIIAGVANPFVRPGALVDPKPGEITFPQPAQTN